MEPAIFTKRIVSDSKSQVLVGSEESIVLFVDFIILINY